MYTAYPDPARFDEHLHSQITIWETDQPGPPIGLVELSALRERRRSGAEPSQATLSVEDLLIDRWGDTAAVARYVLRATTAAGDMTFRVSDVWDASDGSWQIVHHHAELLATAEAGPVVDHPH